MKKIIFSFLTLTLFTFISCQQEKTTKQYFEESPEIEVCKKVFDAYLKGDLEAYRSCYADTARLWHNQYYLEHPGKTIDEQIKMLESAIPRMAYYDYEGEIWEMIVQNTGVNWVHFWGKFVGKYFADDEEIELFVHFAFNVIDDKIVYETGIWDSLPFYLAEQRMQKETN
jgi:hypothetical protein